MGKEIEMQHVTFSYQHKIPQLTDINLNIKAGETVVITVRQWEKFADPSY